MHKKSDYFSHHAISLILSANAFPGEGHSGIRQRKPHQVSPAKSLGIHPCQHFQIYWEIKTFKKESVICLLAWSKVLAKNQPEHPHKISKPPTRYFNSVKQWLLLKFVKPLTYPFTESKPSHPGEEHHFDLHTRHYFFSYYPWRCWQHTGSPKLSSFSSK